MALMTNERVYTKYADRKNCENQDVGRSLGRDRRKEAEELYKMLTIQENNKLNKTINGKLSGLKIYCTGTFENYKKNELEKIVNDNGGEFTNYCKTLDLLVVGNKKGSSKVSKAKNDGIKVMTETEFISLINS